MSQYIEDIKLAYSANVSEEIARVINHGRFPFTYHHDEVRNVAWRYSEPSRRDVASALRERFPDSKEYVDEACRGAFAYIFRAYAGDILEDILAENDNDAERLESYRCMKAHADRFDGQWWIDHFKTKPTEAPDQCVYTHIPKEDENA